MLHLTVKSFICLFFIFSGFANILDHCKKFEHTECESIEKIDYIYLINLDQRTEKLLKCNLQCNLYGIQPQRFPAIYGWSLSPEILNEIGVRFQPEMWKGREFVYDIHFQPNFLNESMYGKTFFSQWTSLGAIGCTLSHLSVLKDAYESQYKTIWVMEDDIHILRNPKQLTKLIEELDTLDEWDVLYTDCDYWHENTIDLKRDLLSQVPWMWRPDLPSFDLSNLFKHSSLGKHFEKIRCRIRAHSLIYRRSGIEKILNFYKNRNMFVPYDWEIALVPNLKLYVLKIGVVSFYPQEDISDTKQKRF